MKNATVDTLEELKRWIEHSLEAPEGQKVELAARLAQAFERHRDLWQESKREALEAMQVAFADKLALVRKEVARRDYTVANITRYFEEVVAELTERARRDPKTKLLNLDWFMERIESFLAIEQRAQWSALGVVDLTGFKWINDNLGHAVGDRVISRVARTLSEQLRSRDLLALDTGTRGETNHRDLHARFGGDEFSFFVPTLSKPRDARTIALRFKRRVEAHPWHTEDAGLLEHPVRVDVGVVCVELGPVAGRRATSGELVQEMVQWADRLMYRAKRKGSSTVALAVARIVDGHLVSTQEEDAGSSPPQLLLGSV